ncbi:MAG TPA: tyrosine--tRNA ligase [Bacteroidetes bacterium]|nr:tyrosine--tRNA ligase [Bacteroidota bacterium]
MPFLPAKDQLDRLKDSVPPVEIIDEAELLDKLERSRAENRPLRIKQGFDASAPDLHIGHAVSIWKLKTFQELGHKVIFLIGDFTGMVGDPSGKSKTRPRLTREQVEANAETYRQQVFRILDPEMTEVRFNSEWHAGRDIYQFLELASHYTVRRMLERDDFWLRFKEEQPISILEFLYPLIQAYDSVALEADVELGGTDQKFNLVLTRHIQRAYGLEPQVLFLMPLLCGTDGNEKMSKSLNNAIGITEAPDEMYGKVMSITDEQLETYFRLATSLSMTEIKARFPCDDPCLVKHELAKHIVSRYHGVEAAEEASKRFFSRFRDKDWPSPKELIQSGHAFKIEDGFLPRIMVGSGSASSGSEARRLIDAGAVSIDGEKFTGGYEIDDIGKPHRVKVGKRRFFLIYSDQAQLKQLC